MALVHVRAKNYVMDRNSKFVRYSRKYWEKMTVLLMGNSIFKRKTRHISALFIKRIRVNAFENIEIYYVLFW
jgi:hypothetical protein